MRSLTGRTCVAVEQNARLCGQQEICGWLRIDSGDLECNRKRIVELEERNEIFTHVMVHSHVAVALAGGEALSGRTLQEARLIGDQNC